jgi:hypothetical protein
VVLWSSKLFWLPNRPCLIWLFMLAKNMNANLAHVNTAAVVASSVVSEILAHRREFIERQLKRDLYILFYLNFSIGRWTFIDGKHNKSNQ